MSFAKFFMQNGIGERYDLNALDDITFTHPEGLGVKLDPKFANLGEGFFNLISSKEEPQTSIVGDLVFKPSAYPKYREFVNWAMSAEELLFVYCPFGNEEYYRRVVFKSLEKGVRGEWGQLSCAVSLACLTPWYLPTEMQLNFDADPDASMKYEFTYTDALVYGTERGGAYSVQIPALGHVPSSLYFSYKGACANLSVTLTGAVTGKVYGTCALTLETGANDLLELSTQPRDSYLRLNGEDILDTVDITQEPFFRAPTDEPSILSLDSDGALGGTPSVKVFAYYRSV